MLTAACSGKAGVEETAADGSGALDEPAQPGDRPTPTPTDRALDPVPTDGAHGLGLFEPFASRIVYQLRFADHVDPSGLQRRLGKRKHLLS